ncbi:alpha/beta hydrolase [Arsenicicoccus sp. oral taxon 190]|uniref:alpha/beta hydrolase n=1 Tax=Arsenicicoccus sp. oral taxon 190 TaxID=1658671 RepID=UPI00067A3F01|nr:alpha/beta hydrolase [Arsenicicoccus sp. oral taxon 190]AKT50573.1 hypothetical protein ADJ73_03305 [Arsenicicoccus sp. oral taxon 190]
MSSPRPPVTLRATRSVLRGLARLPAPVIRAVAGRPRRVDGYTLRGDVQAALRLLEVSPGSDAAELTPEQWRAEMETEAWLFGHRPHVASVRDAAVPGPGGDIPVRVYNPRPDRPAPGVVVYFHGGGFVSGSLDTVDPVCRFLARYSGCVVVSVDYRLAPEHAFPCAVEDAVAAFRHVRDHLGDYAAPDAPVAVMGDSAGGNLAAVVCHRTVEDEAGGPDLQVLLTPVVDWSRKARSYTLFAQGYYLTEATMDWYSHHYLREPEQAGHPDASPLLARHLGGLPPAYVLVAAFDVLRDEGLAYAARLEEAGVPVTLRVDEDGTHGDINAMGLSRASRDLVIEVSEAVRDLLVRR